MNQSILKYQYKENKTLIKTTKKRRMNERQTMLKRQRKYYILTRKTKEKILK